MIQKNLLSGFGTFHWKFGTFLLRSDPGTHFMDDIKGNALLVQKLLEFKLNNEIVSKSILRFVAYTKRKLITKDMFLNLIGKLLLSLLHANCLNFISFQIKSILYPVKVLILCAQDFSSEIARSMQQIQSLIDCKKWANYGYFVSKYKYFRFLLRLSLILFDFHSNILYLLQKV